MSGVKLPNETGCFHKVIPNVRSAYVTLQDFTPDFQKITQIYLPYLWHNATLWDIMTLCHISSQGGGYNCENNRSNGDGRWSNVVSQRDWVLGHISGSIAGELEWFRKVHWLFFVCRTDQLGRQAWRHPWWRSDKGECVSRWESYLRWRLDWGRCHRGMQVLSVIGFSFNLLISECLDIGKASLNWALLMGRLLPMIHLSSPRSPARATRWTYWIVHSSKHNK